MGLQVHLLEEPDTEALAVLRQALEPGVHLTYGKDGVPQDIQVLVAGRPERQHLEQRSQMQAVIIPWAGVPEPTRQLLQAFPEVTLHNLHYNDAATAEMAVALLLAAAKFIVPFDQALRRGDWSPRYLDPNPSVLLNGKTALVLGFGHIGRRVGLSLQALGMEVTGVRRSPSNLQKDGSQFRIHAIADLEDLLPRTCALVIALPATPQTEGLIGKEQLGRMPAGGLLVNVGRGSIVDQEALYEALRTRHLRAAGLDVWYNYPKDEDSRNHTFPGSYPFHELDNLVLSPHRGGGAEGTEHLRMKALAGLLNAAARGEAMPNQVDLAAGY